VVSDGVIGRRNCSSSRPSIFHSATSRCGSRLTCRLSFYCILDGYVIDEARAVLTAVAAGFG
jgi:hypothetical protein